MSNSHAPLSSALENASELKGFLEMNQEGTLMVGVVDVMTLETDKPRIFLAPVIKNTYVLRKPNGSIKMTYKLKKSDKAAIAGFLPYDEEEFESFSNKFTNEAPSHVPTDSVPIMEGCERTGPKSFQTMTAYEILLQTKLNISQSDKWFQSIPQYRSGKGNRFYSNWCVFSLTKQNQQWVFDFNVNSEQSSQDEKHIFSNFHRINNDDKNLIETRVKGLLTPLMPRAAHQEYPGEGLIGPDSEESSPNAGEREYKPAENPHSQAAISSGNNPINQQAILDRKLEDALTAEKELTQKALLSLAQKQGECLALQQSLAAQEGELRRTITSKQQQDIVLAQNKILALEQSVETLTTQLSKAQQKSLTFENELQRIQTENKTTAERQITKITQSENELQSTQDLKKQLDETLQLNKELTTAIESTQQENKKKAAEIAHLQEELRQAKTSMAGTPAISDPQTITRLNAQLRDKQETLKTQQIDITQQKNQIAKLTKELTETQDKVGKLKTERTEDRATITRFETQKINFEAEAGDLKLRTETLVKKLSEEQEKTKGLEALIEQNGKTHTLEISKLTKTNTQANIKLQLAQTRLPEATKRDDISNSETISSTERQKLQTLEQQTRQIQNEVKLQANEITRLKSELETAQNHARQQETAAQERKTTEAKEEKSKAELNVKIAEASQLIGKYQEKVRAYQNKLDPSSHYFIERIFLQDTQDKIIELEKFKTFLEDNKQSPLEKANKINGNNLLPDGVNIDKLTSRRDRCVWKQFHAILGLFRTRAATEGAIQFEELTSSSNNSSY